MRDAVIINYLGIRKILLKEKKKQKQENNVLPWISEKN